MDLVRLVRLHFNVTILSALMLVMLANWEMKATKGTDVSMPKP